MKTSLRILTAFILLNSGCEQFLIDEETVKQITGKVKDSAGNPLQDVKVFLIYNFEHANLNSPASGGFIEQNYPNPFRTSSSFRYTLAESSLVIFDIYRFDGEKIYTYEGGHLAEGTYSWTQDFSQILPSNGYKTIMSVDVGDTVYRYEQSFIKTFSAFDSSIVSTIPNKISVDGKFEIKYDELPLGQTYTKTSETDPVPTGYCAVNARLKLILYKPGFKVLEREVIISLDRYQNMEFVLQPE